MEEYNPNAIWTSKKKKVHYVPPEPLHLPKTDGEAKSAPPIRRTGGSGNGKKIAIIALAVIVVLGGAGAAWFYLTRPVPVPTVTLDAVAPNEVTAGDPFTYSVLYTNSSALVLRNASLAVALPDNVFFAGQSQDERIATISLGDIAAGTSDKKDFMVLVATGAGSVSQVSSTLSYTTDVSRGVSYAVSHASGVAVSGSAIGLAIAAPANVFAGQDFVSTVSYKNNTQDAVGDVRIIMQYPAGFTFAEASPTPAFPGNTTWNLGALAPGAGGEIFITGTMNGQNTALYSMAGTASEDVSGSSYAIAASAANVAITAAPLTIGASLNNSPDYVAGLSDYLDYKITYANTSNLTFNNVAITALLQGAMFDLSSVQSNAAFNSRTDTLTWYAANTPELATVAPGASGSVELRIKTKPSFPIATAADKNFNIGLHLGIGSPTVPAGTAATSTSAFADVSNKVGGAATLSAVGYYYETGTKIANTGPYPPVVNQPTTYTIHWRITNYSTDLSNVSISAYLQSGATCTGKIESTVSAVPVCDAGTGEVTWDIPAIPAGTGVLGVPEEAVFQVENTPAVNQFGQAVTLLGKTSFTATDGFTGKTIQTSANPVGTDLPNDPGVKGSNRSVTE